MQTIHYIKEGKERKTRRLSYALFESKDVYSIKEDRIGTIEYHVSKDIELLHLKNFKFANSVSVYLENENTVFILDHCCFSNRFVVHNGNVSVDTPSYNNSEANMRFVDNKYLELNLKDSEIKNDKINRPYAYYLIRGKELEITGDASKTSLYIRCGNIDKITLKNLEDPDIGGYSADELRIINTRTKMGINTAHDDNRKIYIENSILSAYSEIIHLKYANEVQIKDSIIKSPLILLPNGRIHEKISELEFSTTDENASGNLLSARLSLLSFLKAVGTKAEDSCQVKKDARKKEIEEGSKEIIEDYERWIRYDMNERDYHEREIAKSKEAIEMIMTEKKEEVEHIEKCLRKQKIRGLLPTNKK